MHVRKYVGTMRAELKNMRAYQLDFLGSIIYLPVEMGVVYFLWFVIYSYSGLTAIGGLSFGDVVVYFLLQRIAGRMIGRGFMVREVGEDIRKGNLSVYLCRPVDYPTYKLFSVLSYTTVNLLAGVAIFMVVSASLSLWIQLDPLYWAFFIVSIILGLIIYYSFTLCIGLLAFWTKETGTLLILADGIGHAFSGSMIPLTMYPTEIYQVISFFPFRYIYFSPLLMYLGKMNANECIVEITVQIMYAALLLIVSRIILRSGLKRFDAQGG